MQPEQHARIAAAYRRFADTEAQGRSPLYHELANGVASDPELIEFLAGLPREKRQPNLLFASARSVFGAAAHWGEFRRGVIGKQDAVRELMLRRSTQTNEPGRCAVLLPVLARLTQPLALIEVGASAGLCLLPDRYAYDYGGHVLRPGSRAPEPPVFRCQVNPTTPLPRELPQVVWRAGLDLNPLDTSEPEDRAWLEALVWPEQEQRLARLRAALAIADAEKPRIVKGDLRRDMASLAAEAPKNATLVIFHTAVLAYVSPAQEREVFARSVASLCDFWIANEAAGVFPDLAARAARPGPKGWFLLSLNGAPVAWADPHGAGLEWIG
ncbi:MAG TPA: DUF2332 domain-containing protein [Stellaceae bacterium]